MSVLDLICSNGFITVNRTIASIVGLEAAAVLGELATEYLYWQDRDPDFNGEFYSTIENLESRTFLSAHNQRVALNKLQEQGWIKVKKKGMPAKRYIRVFENKISEVVNDKSLKILTTGDKKIESQDVKNFNIKNNITNNNIEEEINNNIHISETTFSLLNNLPDSLPNKPKKKFIPPTVEEVSEYCKKRNNEVDPVAFVAYYASQNWKKANGRPVSDWKLCVITWEKKDARRQDPTKKSGNPFDDLLAEEGYS